jgi:hypothetical protein
MSFFDRTSPITLENILVCVLRIVIFEMWLVIIYFYKNVICFNSNKKFPTLLLCKYVSVFGRCTYIFILSFGILYNDWSDWYNQNEHNRKQEMAWARALSFPSICACPLACVYIDVN